MYITRKAEFSASHLCRLPALSEEENARLFGAAAHPNGHGHNYILEVTVEGDPDPTTGMIIDLKCLKDILEEEIVTPMDHRFLNYEVPPFDHVVPTAENVASEIFRRLEARLTAVQASIFRVRLWETPDLYVDVEKSRPGKRMSATHEGIA
jgi:6-pyruvoyltetrahydropterin/6-carboxytetrahydropterin synthase